RRFGRVFLDIPNLCFAMHQFPVDVFFPPSVDPDCRSLLPLFSFDASVLVTCPSKQSFSFASTVSADTVRIDRRFVSVEMFFVPTVPMVSWPVCRANDPTWRRESANAFQLGQRELIHAVLWCECPASVGNGESVRPLR